MSDLKKSKDLFTYSHCSFMINIPGDYNDLKYL